jgi:outer membrane protein
MSRFRFLIFCFVLTGGVYGQEKVYRPEDVLAAIVAQNYEIKLSEIEVRKAEGLHHPGVAGMLPSVEFLGFYGGASSTLAQEFSNGGQVNQSGVGSENVQGVLRFSYTLFDGLGMFYLYARLGKEAELASLGRVRQLEQSVYEAMLVYVRLLVLQQQKGFYEKIIRWSEVREQFSEAALKAGTGTKQEWLQAKIDRNGYLAGLAALEMKNEVEQANLNRAMGREPDLRIVVSDTLPLLAESALLLLAGEIELGNTLLKMKRVEEDIAGKAYRNSTSGFMPTLAIQGDYAFNQSRNTAGFFLLNQSYGPSFMMSLRVPIFQGVQQRIKLQQAGMEKDKRSVEKAMLQLRIKHDWYAARREHSHWRKLYILAEENYRLAEENYGLADAGLSGGYISRLQLREAEKSLADAGIRLWDSYAGLKVSELTLMQLAGKFALLNP